MFSLGFDERSIGCLSDTWGLIVHRKEPRLNDESLLRCPTICSLSEADRTWAQLYTPGMLKKVGLLPSNHPMVQVVDAPIDLEE